MWQLERMVSSRISLFANFEKKCVGSFYMATLPSRATLLSNIFLVDLQNMVNSEILDVATRMKCRI